jgi:tetratricopeptide (TPR) repeat protein
VRAILSARIDRLPAAQKELLQTLAVFGKEQPLELIKRITGKDEPQLEPILSGLQAGEFIYEQPSLSDSEYTFKHALTQEVAYNSLLAQRRRVLHEQAARATEALYADRLEEHYVAVAHHYLLSDSAQKAFHYARLAAEQAAARAAYAEASSLIEAALKLLDVLPEDAERMRTELAMRSIEATLAFVLYGASSNQRERAIRRMLELGELLGEPDELVGGRVQLCLLHFTRGEALRGLEVARRTLELIEGTTDAGLLVDAHLIYGQVAYSCGMLRDAASHFETAMVNCARAERIASVAGFFFESSIRCHLATAEYLLGRVGEAAKLAADGLRHARDSIHLFSLGHALAVGGGWLPGYPEPEALLALAEEVITLSEENGFAEWLPWGRFYSGRALFELGAIEGLTEMEAGIAGCQQMGGVPRLQYLIALRAEAIARTGRPQEALAILNEALAHIEGSGELVDHSEMMRLKGEILLMRDGGATNQAEACFRTALDIARGQEAKWWELRTGVSLARLLRNTSRRDEARSMLAEVYNWFTEGFDLPDLNEAKALLDELFTG